MERLRAAILGGCASAPRPRPVPTVVTPEEVDPGLVRSAAAVVVMDEDGCTPQVRRIVSRLPFDGSATVVRIGGTSRSGALVLPEDADDLAVLACLRTIIHGQSETDRLQVELSTTARVAEGVREELTRVDAEMQMAARLQREFIPRTLPELNGTRLAALWRPAGYVSGDIYDVERLDDDHVGIFIADAVGHGVPAALLAMVICRSLPRKEVANDGSQRIIPPAEALAGLNRFMISRQGRTARFATAVYAVCDTRNRIARIASAGHPSVLHLASPQVGGTIGEIPSTGGLLGIFDEERYQQIEVRLGPGEGLVFHSDGFEQAFPRDPEDHVGRRIPNEHHRSVIEDLASREEPEEMICDVHTLLDGHRGSLHQQDDLTMICMRTDSSRCDEGQKGHGRSIASCLAEGEPRSQRVAG